MKKGKRIIKGRLRSFRHAGKALKLLLRERNARVHTAAGIAALGIGLAMKFDTMQWIAVLIAIGMAFTAEAMNTAIEKLCDFVEPGYHNKIKDIKDLAAGAVLLSAMTAAAIGMIVLSC